ncbi:DUF2269 domain-containing protein [Fodinisporobacter ferrooxydans]|uniref:DUF2269 domain-containing protein n=1 Tax=Fodinisporobacter ferrooxydans TaxID=2901836 RepID=A0ABY4CR44_9BACL|nr:DUF2269 domain-containing protein [Alicyclobacillaceae bacterium MYW30-H2]
MFHRQVKVLVIEDDPYICELITLYAEKSGCLVSVANNGMNGLEMFYDTPPDLVIAVAGMTIQDAQMVRAVYLGLELITRFVIVPFGLASLLTGVISSLGTEWGLFRYYWILIKLVITILSTIGLLVHLKPISYLAGIAAERTLSSADHPMQIQIMIVSGAALLALLVATTLSVYKPRGMTSYGWRKQHGRRKVSQQP